MDNPTKANIEGHIGFLDALRGFLAFWVFYGHLKMASIAKDVLWGSPALAVDGFMLLSGFLMVYHWILKKDRFTTFKAQVKDFYLRRYFRIAPLYYSLLSVAFLFQTKLFNIKYAVNTLVPPPWKGRYVIFDNPVVQKLSLANILSHFSFTFGAIPEFANSNILPDWSIGLEMQFYLLFPLLIILISKLGPFTVTFLSLIASIAANKLFGLYQDPGLLGHFGQPSMILFKINFFLAGMAIAYAYLSRENQARISWLVLGVVAIYGANVQVLIIAAVIVYLLIFDHEGKELITKIGSWKFFKFFGDTSYAVYLVHLLIIYPVLYLLFKNVWFQDQGEYVKLLVSLVIITPIVYGTATILHKTIEIGGIRLGKRITNRLGGRVSGRPQAPSVDV